MLWLMTVTHNHTIIRISRMCLSCVVLFGLRARFHSNILRTHTPSRCFRIEYNQFMWISCIPIQVQRTRMYNIRADVYMFPHIQDRHRQHTTPKKKKGDAYRSSRKHETLLPRIRAATYTHALKTYVYTWRITHRVHMPTTLSLSLSLPVKTKTPREKGGWHSDRKNCHHSYTITRQWMRQNLRWLWCNFFVHQI